jgi:transcriptional regulator with XRE-family HTH domain
MLQEDITMDDYSEGAATFGDRLALAREAQNLTQEQLARRLGLRVQTVENWETDRSEPRANKLQMLAGFLNVSMIWLLTGEGEGRPQVVHGAKASVAPAEVTSMIDEIRDLRLTSARVGERLARLEKRLRQMTAPA